jgi:hypothetical protein
MRLAWPRAGRNGLDSQRRVRGAQRALSARTQGVRIYSDNVDPVALATNPFAFESELVSSFPYEMQGDHSLYTADALEKRRALATHPLVTNVSAATDN